jgi:AraC-like DNA-binding protein
MIGSMGTITSLFARKMVAAAGPGVDGPALLAAAGLDPDAPWDPKVRLVDTVYYDLLERLAEKTDAGALPIEVGASMRCDEYGALGLAWKAAPTLLDSFRRVERFARLWTSVVEYELQSAPGGMLFVLNRAGLPRHGLHLSNEATLASAVSISRQVSPLPFAPLEVRFRHPAPASAAAHEAYFGCPVRFGAERDVLLLPAEALARPNRLGDKGITRFLLSCLEAELSGLAHEETLETRAKDAIARALSEGPPRVADIAPRLGLSVRSLHRRLAEHGINFQTLADDTRRELALGLLADERHSLAEIAFLTGFSEQSAFTRAFKRWVGRTPASWRKDRARA